MNPARGTFRIWILDRRDYLELVVSDASGTMAREVSSTPLKRFLNTWIAHTEHTMAVGRARPRNDAALKEYSLNLSSLLLGGRSLARIKRLELSSDRFWTALPVEILPYRGGYAYQKIEIVRDLRIQSSTSTLRHSPPPRHPLFVFGDPSRDIQQEVDREVQSIIRSSLIRKKLFPEAKKKLHWPDLLKLAARKGCWHFAGHGGADWISAGGLRLEAREVRSMHLALDCVFLNGCNTGRAESQESMVSAFLEAGAANVVGYLGRIESRFASAGALAFWQAMARGSSVQQSLHSARQSLEEKFGKGHPSALLLVGYTSSGSSSAWLQPFRKWMLYSSVTLSLAVLAGMALPWHEFRQHPWTRMLVLQTEASTGNASKTLSDIPLESVRQTPSVFDHPPSSVLPPSAFEIKPGQKKEPSSRTVSLQDRPKKQTSSLGPEASKPSDADHSTKARGGHEPAASARESGPARSAVARQIRQDQDEEPAIHLSKKGTEFDRLARSFLINDHAFYSKQDRISIVRTLQQLDVTETERIVRLRGHMLSDSD